MPTIKTEKQMINLGEALGKTLTPPATIELIGDVGAGKTTFTKGLARALGITTPITSPSFTLSKAYVSTGSDPVEIRLNHYDFYRLQGAGIMAEDLAESISDPSTITVVEWAETVADVLPANHIKVTIAYLSNGDRQVEIAK